MMFFVTKKKFAKSIENLQNAMVEHFNKILYEQEQEIRKDINKELVKIQVEVQYLIDDAEMLFKKMVESNK